MNICLVSREYPVETGWGGIGTYTYNLAHGLVEKGNTVHVVCQSLDVDKEEMDGPIFVHRIAHCTIFHHKMMFKEFGLRLEYSLKVARVVRKLVREAGIDIIEGPNLSGETFWLMLNKPVPVVTRIHTGFEGVVDCAGIKKSLDLRLSFRFEEAVLGRSDAILCSTRNHAEHIIENLPFLRVKLHIVPLGIPLTHFVEKKNEGQDKTVLFVGRLEKRKGVHTLMKAIPRVLESFPEARFIISGRDTFQMNDGIMFTGPEERSFKHYLLSLLPDRFRDRVTFTGYVKEDELDRLYRECDVFAAPSLYESFGLIYVEAMSRSKPVIGCGVGGVPEVIKDGETGFLVPPDDHSALSQRIVQLLKDRGLRERLGRQARLLTEKSFSSADMAERTLEVYRKLLK